MTLFSARLAHEEHSFSLGALSPWRLLDSIDRAFSWLRAVLGSDRAEEAISPSDASPLAIVVPREELACFRRLTLRP